MFEKINESVEVLARFAKDRVEPARFRWRNRIYDVEKVNLVHKERRGSDKIYYFSVSDNANSFRLAFSTRDLSWTLEELYTEG
ncbi:MAG: hypothetical protein V1867_02455 [Candidatus Falkowbacteria bacterium]